MERVTFQYANGDYLIRSQYPDRLAVNKLGQLEDAIELLTKCGIALVVPESECLNDERLTIQLYKKHTTKEQWEKLLELFDIK